MSDPLLPYAPLNTLKPVAPDLWIVDGEVIHTDSVPLGGTHVTNDIRRGLSTPLAHAERMKSLLGSVIPSASDDQEIIKVPLVGEDSQEITFSSPTDQLDTD